MLRVAAHQRRQRPDGESHEAATWFGLRARGTLGERCATLDTGTRVLVIGRLDICPYQRQDGAPVVAYDVWADEVLNLSPRTEVDGGAEPAEPSTAPPSTAASGAPASGQARPIEPAEDEDDLPSKSPTAVHQRQDREVPRRPWSGAIRAPGEHEHEHASGMRLFRSISSPTPLHRPPHFGGSRA